MLRRYEPFRYGTTSFLHGFTFGGHPAGAAIALANLDIFEREGINEHVRSLEVKSARFCCGVSAGLSSAEAV